MTENPPESKHAENYMLLPFGKEPILIPYGEKDSQAEILSTALAKLGDWTSPTNPSLYPHLTNEARLLWYPDTKILPIPLSTRPPSAYAQEKTPPRKTRRHSRKSKPHNPFL